MRKFHSIAALCGDGLRPELQALFDRLAIDPRSELFVRSDGMTQSGQTPCKTPKFKLGHCENQNRPLRVETGQYQAAHIKNGTTAAAQRWQPCGGPDRTACDSPQNRRRTGDSLKPTIRPFRWVSLIVADLHTGKWMVRGAYCDLWMIPRSSYIPIRIRELGTGNCCSEAKGLPMANPPTRKKLPTWRLGRL